VGGPIGRMLIRRYNFFARTIMRRAFADKSRLSAAVHEHYLRALAHPEDRTGCLVLPKQIIASTAWLERLWKEIPRLADIPKLIVWGMKDISFREKELKRWERTFPQARSIRLDSVGHFIQEEAPEELADSVAAFLHETEQP
jgi:haloalkane dehalogenase